MKKILLCIIILLLTANLTFANEVRKISLNKGSIYLLLLDSEPINFKISNPNVLQIQLVPTLDNNKQQVLIQTLTYGKSSFEAQTAKESYKYDCNVVDGAVTVDDDLFEIEKPQKGLTK